MQRNPAALDRQVQTCPEFLRRAFLAEQEGPVDQLDVNPAVLHNLDDAISIILRPVLGIGPGGQRELHADVSMELLPSRYRRWRRNWLMLLDVCRLAVLGTALIQINRDETAFKH